jgi:uncharacterized protein (DUF433 family)
LGIAELHEAGTFGVFHHAALERYGAQLVGDPAARPHGGSSGGWTTPNPGAAGTVVEAAMGGGKRIRTTKAIEKSKEDPDMIRQMIVEGAVMSYQDIITIEAGKRGGRPCVRHMRIAVADVLGWLAAGMSHDQIFAEFPELTEDDIRACLAYAADRERRLLTAAK